MRGCTILSCRCTIPATSTAAAAATVAAVLRLRLRCNCCYGWLLCCGCCARAPLRLLLLLLRHCFPCPAGTGCSFPCLAMRQHDPANSLDLRPGVPAAADSRPPTHARSFRAPLRGGCRPSDACECCAQKPHWTRQIRVAGCVTGSGRPPPQQCRPPGAAPAEPPSAGGGAAAIRKSRQLRSLSLFQIGRPPDKPRDFSISTYSLFLCQKTCRCRPPPTDVNCLDCWGLSSSPIKSGTAPASL
jgi:hypothetical protein